MELIRSEGLAMTSIIKLDIPGKPYAKSRPRTFMRGGRSITVSTPKGKQKDYQNNIISHADEAYYKIRLNRPEWLSGPIGMEAYFFFKADGKKHKIGDMHTYRPDWDNLVKQKDAIYKSKLMDSDDCQIVYECGAKLYGAKDRTIFILRPIAYYKEIISMINLL